MTAMHRRRASQIRSSETSMARNSEYGKYGTEIVNMLFPCCQRRGKLKECLRKSVGAPAKYEPVMPERRRDAGPTWAEWIPYRRGSSCDRKYLAW